MKKTNWVVSPLSNLQEGMHAKKEEERRLGAGALSHILPLSKKSNQKYVLQVSLESLDSYSHGGLHRTKIDVLQEMDDEADDEEEKLAPTQVASFAIQETLGDKFPWAFINRDTGLEIAFYKHKTTNFTNHLDQTGELQRQQGLNLELYGKTPLYENQKYRKKDNKEIIYHWASTKIKYASKLLGFISFSEQMEMITKHETPQDFKLVKDKSGNNLQIQSSRNKTVATCKIVDGGQQMQVTVAAKVDPAIVILFLAMTGTLGPASLSS